MLTKTQRNRRYKLHYKLRKAGNELRTRGDKCVIKRAVELTTIENKYIKELIGYGYCVSERAFY